MMASSAAFRRTLLAWYGKHGRDLPWRRTRDPYAILVSEIMLQQTQVGTVIPYYDRWLRRFPDFRSLATASESDVLHAWQGLGYYARARNLHAAAKMVVHKYDGDFPKSPASIRELPGLGRYTANAVATFAFGTPAPIVEANIARLLSRLLNIQDPIDGATGRDRLWTAASVLVPRRDAARFNSALIDLGATVCTARQPKCSVCAVSAFCRATEPEKLPLKKRRPRQVALGEDHAFAVRRGRLLLEQSQRRWRGMWILPPLPNKTMGRPIYRAEFPFTHHRVTFRVFRCVMPRPSAHSRWFRFMDLVCLPIPSPHRRALTHLLGAERST